MAEGNGDHPRLLLPGFVPLDLCKELEFIHRSCGTVGYRSGVFSTTLSHLIATGCSHLIIPFVSARERLKEKVEEFFSCEYEIVIEFTGLVSWCKGASIGWHSDDNRPYLKQRDFTAVCYLNNYCEDFKGGLLRFEHGKPTVVVPKAGDAVIYTADNRNVHSVDEVTAGERLTLTLWFSRDSSHDEDAKLIARLCEIYSDKCIGHEIHLPLPASSNMYWFSEGQDGCDIRLARISTLGYSICKIGKENCAPYVNSWEYAMEQPLQLCRKEEIYHQEFANSMHALQVVQFYYWRASQIKGTRRQSNPIYTSKLLLLHETNDSTLVGSHSHQLAESIFGNSLQDNAHASFNWIHFAISVEEWEEYVKRYHDVLLSCIPFWRTHQIIFSAPPVEPEHF